MNENYVGQTVGIYTIIELMPYRAKDGHLLYKGVCNDCGFERIAALSDLKAAKKCKHIGCGGNNISYSAFTWDNKRIGRIFSAMKQRCYNKNDKSYRFYGAKGIQVCDKWINNPKLFEEWSLQNGYNDSLTIDRKDSRLDYSPENCRWIKNELNSKYKSTTTSINVDGEVHSGRDWSKILGLGTNTINTYIRKYGLENTIIFIKKYLEHPNLKPKPKSKQSYYDLYMNNTDINTDITVV